MAKAEDLVLLQVPVSPYATKVRIALEAKGLKYECKEEDLSNKSSLLQQMNPIYKKIPVLIHNGKPICESANIVQYIDEVWTHSPQIFPSDPYQRSHARFWADFIDKKIYSGGHALWASKGETKEGAKKELVASFKTLEEELGNKAYFGGEICNFIDLTLIPSYAFFLTFEKIGNLNVEAECPKIVEWAKRCIKEKECVSKTLPDQEKVYEVALIIRKKLGVD